MKKGILGNERVGQNLSFGNTKNQAGRKFILSAMGMKPIPRTEGPKGGFEGRRGGVCQQSKIFVFIFECH